MSKRSAACWPTSVSAAGSDSVRPVTSSWQNKIIPRPSRYSISGLYCRLNPPSTIGKKSPQAGFSINADATLPRLPQRQTCVTGMPHHSIVGPMHRPHFVIEPRRQNRRRAAPIAQIIGREPGQQRMIGHTRKNLPQAVLRHTESESLFQHIRRSARTRSHATRRAPAQSTARDHRAISADLPTISMSIC